MLYAELDKNGMPVGINDQPGDGKVSCDGLTQWQLDHQGLLRYANGAWDTSQVPTEPVPVVILTPEEQTAADLAKRKQFVVDFWTGKGWSKDDAEKYAGEIIY